MFGSGCDTRCWAARPHFEYLINGAYRWCNVFGVLSSFLQSGVKEFHVIEKEKKISDYNANWIYSIIRPEIDLSWYFKWHKELYLSMTI